MPLKELNNVDSLLTRRVKRQDGLSISDSAIGFCLPTKSYGGGIGSFVGTNISGNARELKATLANPANNSRALHSSLNLSAYLPVEHRPKTKRATEVSTIKLARFGINLQDMSDKLLSIFLEKLQQYLQKNIRGKV